MASRPPLALASAIAVATLALACRSPGSLPPREPGRAPTPEQIPPPAPTEPAPTPAPLAQQEVVVTATAYNSLPSQGVGGGKHGAWGDRLRPGMKTIAVSHDLIALGLTRGAVVEIDGLPGDYTVLDRLPRRWKRRIDIYMGSDVRAARAWGRREVRIRWEPAARHGN